MNNDLEKFSEERLKEIANFAMAGAIEVVELARIALSAKQAKPVGYAVFAENGNIRIWSTDKHITEDVGVSHPLYTTPQPAHTEQHGWIKCSDRMPDSKNDVQLFCSDTREQFVGFHRGNGMFQFFNMNDVIGECEPTHWMPLAATPKPESE
ncbi:DUF551 domain-containing protein [Rahnella variigena]|uniref:DUF551 domain-containing protein n=1 Tax=Rahnella variigena TaxID=574964 RepID=UPI0028DCA8B3|nr:DUF551 domain-containing protein [Rahnella variigena]